MQNEDCTALKALGIKTGVTYSVVKVGCTETGCVDHSLCQDNGIGLIEGEKGGFMICHTYRRTASEKECDKKVFWERVVSDNKILVKGPGSMSTYGDREMGEGMSYPNCQFAGKYHQAENDCNCNHKNTGDVFFCATHHIKGFQPCPLMEEK